MSAVIIYDSRYGHTQQYAEWLADELKISVYRVSELGGLNLTSYDTLIFGGSIFMGRIRIASIINDMMPLFQNKRVICFTVGMHPVDEIYFDEVLMNNFNYLALQGVEFFQLQGAVNPEKISLKDRVLLWGVRKFGRKVSNAHVGRAVEGGDRTLELTSEYRHLLTPLLNRARECERLNSWRMG